MRKAIFTYPDYGYPVVFPEHKEHSGQIVEVGNMVDDVEGNLLYEITASDGWQGEAYENELTFIEE